MFALFAVPLSMSVYGQTKTSYSVVFSNSTDFKTKVEVPMVAALYRNDKDAKIAHTKDNSRWQISLKYDDPRWKAINDGTVYWYIKTSGGGIIGPSTNEEDMDDGTDNSSESASVRDRMLYKNETSLKTDGTESSFTYFKCTKGKASAVSCTFAYAAAAYESSSNNGSQLTYGNPSVQYWRNKSGIKYSLTYNATSSSSLPLPYYDGTFCYVKKPVGWGKICAWVYDDKTQYSSASNWPGEELTTTTEYDGQTYYLWKMGSGKTGTPTKVTFNDGNGDTKVKTGDLPFKSGNIYDASKSTDYILGTVTKQSDATDPTAAYEKFYAYGFWGGKDASFKEMSPVVYYNDKHEVDSVVYYTNMSNVNASFDNFFFMFCSQRYMESWDKWMTNDGKGAWDFVWRPEIFDNRDCNTLSGALYQAGNDLSNIKGTSAGASYFTGSPNPLGFKTTDTWMGKNQMQSINPLLTDEQKQNYDSYTLSLNVTTGTYNVEFHDAIQIVGPAVESGTNWTVDDKRNYTSTENATCGTWNKEKAITLKPSDDGSYYYTTVTLKAGEKFRFIENNKYLTNFGEDDVTPSATDFAPTKENGDVCYYNHISRNTLTEDADPKGESGESGLAGKDITFTMPGLKEGDTYETEIRVSAANASDQRMTGKAAPFYTITRPVKLFKYGNDGNGYTSFACNYPLEIVDDKVGDKDVKVYDIISYDMTTNKATLRNQSDNYKTSTKQYIPAKSGVILSATATDKVSTITVRPMIEKLGETVDNGSNLLKPVYLPGQKINMTLPESSTKTGDPVTSRQYLFSWVKQDDNTYKLGFLRSKTGVSVSERAYLSLTGEAVGATTLNPIDQAAYERVEGISTDNSSVDGAKEYLVNLFFEDSDDNVSDGISTIVHQDKFTDSGAYYTLQGIRVNKPSRAGIYIHNGKKIIVK
ncbi:starch-binding protein [Prevotella lacticifex]|nr:starch-binding protein [Prevotella lacticifex]